MRRTKRGWLVGVIAASVIAAGCVDEGDGGTVANVTATVPIVKYSDKAVYADGSPVQLNEQDCPEDYERNLANECTSPGGTLALSVSDVAWRTSNGRQVIVVE